MAIVPRQKICPQSNWVNKCPFEMAPEWITVHNCLPINTELLTPAGWKKLSELGVGDVVATVSAKDLSIKFDKITYKQSTYLSPTIVAGRTHIEATQYHRMMVQLEDGSYDEKFMGEIRDSGENYKIPNAGYYTGAKGLPLSDWEIRLLVAIQADGTLVRYKYKGQKYDQDAVSIALKKERKILRLREILNHLDFAYSERLDVNGCHRFAIYGEKSNNLCDTYMDEKVFNWRLLDLNYDQAQVFIDELSYWGGSRAERKNMLERRYASSVKQNLDVVAAVASLNGIGTIRNGAIISFRRAIVRDLGHRTKWGVGLCPVSCVTVPSGYILIRQDGVTTVVGNTQNSASADAEITYMNRNTNQVSFHFAIDDVEVVQGIPLNRNSWNAGDGANGPGNRKSIAIEICYSKSGGERFLNAEKLAAKFIAQLLRERGWGIDRVTTHQHWSGKNCPALTLKLGWQRFLDMVTAELNPPAQTVLDWVDNPGSGVIDGTTDLINIPTGKFLKKLSGQFDYVQTTKDGVWARTDYSRDHNLDNGVRTDAFKKPVSPVIEWQDVEPTTMYIKGETNLTNLDTGAVVKVLSGEFTYVQVTADGKWVRTDYSRDHSLNTAVLLADLEPIPEPEPTPPEDDTPDQTITILQSIVTFIQSIINKLRKK